MTLAPLTDVALTEEDVQAVLDCLRSGWLTMGPRTRAFEAAFAEPFGAPHAVAVSSGTAALHLACLAAGIGAGDEVIVPAITFVASAAAVRYVGAEPVLCDVAGPAGLQPRPRRTSRRGSRRARARSSRSTSSATPPRCGALRALCDEHGLVLIEDCAQAIGARLDESGAQVGTVGELGAFSFFSKKQLCVGEGGMVSTDDEQIAARVRPLRSHAMTQQHLGSPPRPRRGLRHRRRRLQLPARRAAGGARPEPPGAPRRGHRAPPGARARLPRAPRGGVRPSSLLGGAGGGMREPLRVSGAAARSRAPRPLPRSARRGGDSDDVVSGAADVHRVPRLRTGGQPTARERGRRSPLRAAAQRDDGRGRRGARRRRRPEDSHEGGLSGGPLKTG